MKNEEMFLGFTVAAGEDRFREHIKLGGEPNDCKVSAKDTQGAMSVFEFTGSGSGPLHTHYDQDEWIYVMDGKFVFQVGEERFQVGTGESIFLPRNVAHAWSAVGRKQGKIINVYQPAGKMEEFFREVGKFNGSPSIHEVMSLQELHQLFHSHGMDLAGPPLTGEWKVDKAGRITQVA